MAPAASLPKLPLLDPSTAHTFTPPSKRIHEGQDVSHFLTTLAYRDIGVFVLQLNHAVIPRNSTSASPVPTTFKLPSASSESSTPSIKALQGLLSKVESYLDEAPPDPGPRRFGNVSFRKWNELVEQRVGELLGEGLLGETLKDEAAKDEVSKYFLGSWGSSQRLDYGTGHELSFLAFLGCLWKLGLFKDGEQDGPIEREIVLSIIERQAPSFLSEALLTANRYLSVARKLILTYTLEPAGSHGVWGLDDHSFIPYIFGSAQLTRPIDPLDPTPIEGSVRGAPRPADVTKSDVVEDYRQTNMYFSAIGFINDVKKGPFWEHSPILFDISGIRDGWGKINKGMIKMFNAEVLSKFPVVQHFPFGSLFSWEKDPEAAEPVQSVHMANQPAVAASAPSTGAPWAQATRMPPTSGAGGIPYSRVPPGPSSGTLGARPPPQQKPPGEGSTDAQITMTKAPWAK